MRISAADGRVVDLAPDEVASALAEMSRITGGSSAAGEFSMLFGLSPNEVVPAGLAKRLAQEASTFLGRHEVAISEETKALLMQLAELLPEDTSAIDRVAAMWDGVVEGFLNGGPAVPQELESWFRSYSGKGAGAVDQDALPEPYLGPIHGRPDAVFLALNPGRSFDFQKRHGRFAQRIRELGSYSDWAASWPYLDGDWEAVGMPPNRHHQSRLSFLRRWTEDPQKPAEAMVSFELYPWHSTKVTGRMRPDPEVVEANIWAPIADLGCPLVFAFGAAWFPLLESELKLEVIACLGKGGDPFGSKVPSRSVLVLRGPHGITVVAEKHSGSAIPPNPEETVRLRVAVMRAMDRA